MSSELVVDHRDLSGPGEKADLSIGLPAATRRTPLSLRTNFSWTFAGNIVYTGCQWGMLMAMAKLGSAQLVGQFALGLAVTGPVIMFSSLQLRNVQAGDARRRNRFSDYLALRLVCTAAALLFIGGLAYCGGYGPETTLVILAVGIAKAFEATSDVCYGALQQEERMDRVARSMLIKGPVSLAAFTAATFATGSALWASAALAGVWGLVLALHDLPMAARILRDLRNESIRPRWNISAMAELARLALPLGIAMMLISLNVNIPRYFVESHRGERELGIFAAMAYILLVGNTVVSALGQSASPRLARQFAEGDLAAYGKLLRQLLAIGGLMGGVGVLASLVIGRPLLVLLYSPEYAERVDVFCWLMTAGAAANLCSVLGYGMTAARCFRPQVPLFGLSVVISVLACYWLVPSYGLRGAAWALLASYSVQLLGCLVIHAQLIGIRGNGAMP